MNKKIIKKLNSNKGYSIAESLICVLILLLVSGAMIAGLQFAVNEYKESMELSQSTILCSTLSNKITAQLTTQATSYLDSNESEDDKNKVEFPAFQIVDKDGNLLGIENEGVYGYVQMGVRKNGKFTGTTLLPNAAYTYEMKATVDVVPNIEGKTKFYTIRLIIKDKDEKLKPNLTSTVFDVIVNG